MEGIFAIVALLLIIALCWNILKGALRVVLLVVVIAFICSLLKRLGVL